MNVENRMKLRVGDLVYVKSYEPADIETSNAEFALMN